MSCDVSLKDLVLVVNLKGEVCAFDRSRGSEPLWRLNLEKIFGPTLRISHGYLDLKESYDQPSRLDGGLTTTLQNWYDLRNLTGDIVSINYRPSRACLENYSMYIEPVGPGTIYFNMGGILRKFERSISELASSRVLYYGNSTFVGRKDSNIMYLNPCDGKLIEHIGTSSIMRNKPRESRDPPYLSISVDSHRLIVESREETSRSTIKLEYLSFYLSERLTLQDDKKDIIHYDDTVPNGSHGNASSCMFYTYDNGILKIIDSKHKTELLSIESDSPPVAVFHFYLDPNNLLHSYTQEEITVDVGVNKNLGGALVSASSFNGACCVFPDLNLSNQPLTNTLGIIYPRPITEVESKDISKPFHGTPISALIYKKDYDAKLNALELVREHEGELETYGWDHSKYKLTVYIDKQYQVNESFPKGLDKTFQELGGADYGKTRWFFLVLVFYAFALLSIRGRIRYKILRILTKVYIGAVNVLRAIFIQNTKPNSSKAVLECVENERVVPSDTLKNGSGATPQPPSVASVPATNNTTLFELKDILGRGSNGTVVFRAIFRNKEIAVKRVLSDFYNVANKELKILEMSDIHRNIIRYYSYENTGSFIYIGLELCYGSLYDLIESSHQNEHLTCAKKELTMKSLIKQIALGMNHLHLLNIVHRDIKPHNILIASSNSGDYSTRFRVVVSDFGLGKVILKNIKTSPASSIGTPARGTFGWRSPEMILKYYYIINDNASNTASELEWRVGKSSLTNNIPLNISTPADIFSMGCCFYYILTDGRHPFGSPEERELNIIKNKRPHFDRDIKEQLHVDLISRMLSFNPKFRPGSTFVLNHASHWDNSKKLTFLADLSDVSKFSTSSINKSLINDIELRRDIFSGNWMQKIPPVVMRNFGLMSSYRPHSVISLLRFIRNIKNHMWSLNEEEKFEIGSNYNQIMNFFDESFPSLFIHVYRVALKYSRHLGEDFEKRYFRNTSETSL